MNIPVIGFIENMSYIVCPGCETVIHFHEQQGSRNALCEMGIPLLGELPMRQEIARLTSGDDASVGMMFKEITERLLKLL